MRRTTIKRKTLHALVCLVVGTALALPASAQETKPNPDRKAYFGELHIHSSYSCDAYVFGTKKLGPEEATKYAMGRPVTHPGGFEVQLPQPLDFTVVMDHSEYTGVFPSRTTRSRRSARMTARWPTP